MTFKKIKAVLTASALAAELIMISPCIEGLEEFTVDRGSIETEAAGENA